MDLISYGNIVKGNLYKLSLLFSDDSQPIEARTSMETCASDNYELFGAKG